MRSIILISVVMLFPSVSIAQVYKCVNENGGVAFSDKPCKGGAKEQKTNLKRKANSSKLVHDSNPLVFEEMDKSGYLDNPKVKSEFSSIAKAAALKLYTRSLMYSHIDELCSEGSPESGVSAAVFTYFGNAQDSLNLGAKVFNEGFTFPEKNYSVSAVELQNKVRLGRQRNSKKFTVSRERSKETVVKECDKFAKFVTNANKVGL